MRLGIVGAGRMGEAFARIFAAAGHEVAIANSRGPASLQSLADELGERVRATTVPEAVAAAEVVLVAVPYGVARGLLAEAGPWDGRVLVDVTNFYAARDGRNAGPGGEPTSVVLARAAPGARVVKAFNTVFYRRLLEEGRAPGAPGRLAVPYSTDDPEAGHLVASLIDEAGFDAVHAGGLAESTRQEPGAPVYDAPLDAAGVTRSVQSGR